MDRPVGVTPNARERQKEAIFAEMKRLDRRAGDLATARNRITHAVHAYQSDKERLEAAYRQRMARLQTQRPRIEGFLGASSAEVAAWRREVAGVEAAFRTSALALDRRRRAILDANERIGLERNRLADSFETLEGQLEDLKRRR
jgi:chromosome segregation ATPase